MFAHVLASQSASLVWFYFSFGFLNKLPFVASVISSPGNRMDRTAGWFWSLLGCEPTVFMTSAAAAEEHRRCSHVLTHIQHVKDVLVVFKTNANVGMLTRGPEICTRTPKDLEM